MSAFPGVSSYQSSSLGSKFVVIGVVCCQEMRGNALFHKVLRVLTKYLIEKLHTGDVLVTQSIDRLGRNYDEILEQWRLITKERKAAIVVLDMPLLDTREDRDLTGILIADIVLQLLSYVAQKERESIRQRQTEGIAAAKARGVHCGRKRIHVPDGFVDIAAQWENRGLSATAAAAKLGMSRDTFLRRAREFCVDSEN